MLILLLALGMVLIVVITPVALNEACDSGAGQRVTPVLDSV